MVEPLTSVTYPSRLRVHPVTGFLIALLGVKRLKRPSPALLGVKPGREAIRLAQREARWQRVVSVSRWVVLSTSDLGREHGSNIEGTD